MRYTQPERAEGMILTLEVVGAQAAKLGSGHCRTFASSGGIIGRDRGSDWVLSHTKVSARHATVSYSNGVFYIEDTSTNGVFINSPKNRLERGRPYPLRSGDRVYIDPYEIRASIEDDEESPRAGWSDDRRVNENAHAPFESRDPLRAHTFPQASSEPPIPGRSHEAAPGQEVDPLKLLDPGPAIAPPRKTPRASDLEFNSPVNVHFKPPAIKAPPAPAPAPAPPPSPAFLIPADYDPLKDDGDDLSSWEPEAPLMAAPLPPSIEEVAPEIEPGPVEEPAPVEVPRTAMPTPVPRSTPAPVRPPSRETPPPATVRELPQRDLTELLEGAGLEGIAASEELVRSFGRILRVVVSGVMDVLRSRQQIKDEFRMRMTQFRPADNNPLKFSANVEDALHNLLVKRNAAYLAPVEAFEDAFEDLRNHQLAMLAGMRVAFESMLAQFNPDHLQAQFDRSIQAGWLSMPGKLRYWDQYRDRHEDMLKDADTAFRKLFGEEFARAYEEQLQRLKAESHSRAPAPPPGRSHDG